jgi:crotonobetainyl-CoA:carnitine CoA-transferase CaiB-like acyl-CoA transferase
MDQIGEQSCPCMAWRPVVLETDEALNAGGVPVGPVATARDVIESPHTKARQILINVTYCP